MTRLWGESGPVRLPAFLRRRVAERRRVDSFVTAIRLSAVHGPVSEPLPTPRPPADDDTVLVPRIILLAAVRLR